MGVSSLLVFGVALVVTAGSPGPSVAALGWALLAVRITNRARATMMAGAAAVMAAR
ncbi:hypothetical protein [Burkholderia plantarii]|uniref:hypothetical protein n=1 Tax=Burkholderia plantarii TaxID=41899 RepID=UPI0018DE5142|nr:hypothetical protein [Burkholderia plantarii]MBI0327986.1 hypothetical protein [Burkholderia plantarii]